MSAIMRIGIVADDLTGAADAVAPFARRGLRSTIAIGGNFVPEDIEAASFNSNTRDANHSPALHASIVRRVTRRLKERDAGLFYKKIDSTLRGHLRLELDAMRRELPDRIAIVCPAFPVNGRVVRNGVLYIKGEIWTQTEFAPSYEVEDSVPTIRDAFGYTDDPSAAEISLPILRKGVTELEANLFTLVASGVTTVFCDAETPDDLDIMAQIVLRWQDRALPVGSAGLSNALAECLYGRRVFTPTPLVEPFLTGQVFVAIGSLHSASRRQAALLMERTGVTPVFTQKEALKQIEANQRIVLQMTPEKRTEQYMSVALSYGAWIKRPPLSRVGLVLTGGDTAQQVLSNLPGIVGVRIVGEIEPGVVMGQLYCHENATGFFSRLSGSMVILKAGGFGDDETLLRCVGLA